MQYRQEVRNLDRLVTAEGIIGRKKRNAFNKFLEHPDPRVRRYAEELAAQDIESRALLRSLEDDEYCEPEDDYLEFEEDSGSRKEMNGPDDDMPF